MRETRVPRYELWECECVCECVAMTKKSNREKDEDAIHGTDRKA